MTWNFANPTAVGVVGEFGLILMSADGGKTWSKQRGGGLFDPQLFAVTCAGEGKVVAAGQRGEILYTADKGLKWVATRAPRSTDIYDLVLAAPGRSIACVGRSRGNADVQRGRQPPELEAP